MALKKGPAIPGAEAYAPALVAPQLIALVADANAGGADVAATFMGQTAIDQPLIIDYRIYFVFWDKAWSVGNVTIKPTINGSAVNAGAHDLIITPKVAAGYTYKVIAPGSAAIGHGDTSGFKVSCAAGFTTTGNLSLTVLFWGAATVQPHFNAWTPS